MQFNQDPYTIALRVEDALWEELELNIWEFGNIGCNDDALGVVLNAALSFLIEDL